MLTSRVLRVLLLGLAVFADADLGPGPQSVQNKPCCLEEIGLASGLAKQVDALSAEPTRRRPNRVQRKVPALRDLWRYRPDQNPGFVRVLDQKKTKRNLGARQEPPSLVSIVVATTTTTTTKTVTSFVATVVSTFTQTLTFLNPTLQTQTQTITITSAIARQKRSPGTVLPENALPETTGYTFTAATDAPPGLLLSHGKRQVSEASVVADIPAVQTSTTTATATTTITVGAGTRTRIITIFATVTVAPNAKTTIFITTTIFTTRTAITTSVAGEPTTATNPGATGGTTRDPAPGSGTGTAGETSTAGTSTTAAPTTATSFPSTSAVTSASIPPTSTAATPGSSSGTAGPGTSALPSPTSGPPHGSAVPGSILSSDQIAGIVLGLIFFIFLLIIASLLLRRVIQKRRAAQAERRHGLGLDLATTAPSGSPAASNSTPGDANQVRIVIRPPPRDAAGAPADQPRWPTPPPGHDWGPTLFLDNDGNTHGRSSPAAPPDSRRWSITSDFGGTPGLGPPEPAATAGAGAVRYSGVPSSGVMGRFSVADGSSVEHDGPVRGVEHTTGGRRDGSGNASGAESGSSGAPRTRLSPPPARSAPGYNLESIGIGRAI
ncbi:hypothetical protein RB595_005755 [Gaeumannomyces hyphopodioides]